ncbi:MAG: choice-of-anchor N protein [Planctomycetales bacterium]|nr:choice-of-anchor N protein [Planctomycetales bacterium]
MPQLCSATPILQIYLEGGVYDTTTESWSITPAGSSNGAPFRIWTIGNLDGPGGKSTIYNVRLAIAFDSIFAEDLEISIEGSQMGGVGVGSYNGFTDPSIADDPILNTVVTTSEGVVTTADGIVSNGSRPTLSNGSALPPNGIYGDNTSWMEFALGDFDTPDSQLGDFINTFPTASVSAQAQINVYEISVLNGHGATLYFDLYDSVLAGNRAKAVFAPFSHDGNVVAYVAPEPGSFVIWSLLGVGAIAQGRQRRKRTAAAAA